MDFATWTKIALICILGAMSPGPSLAIIIRNTTGGGQRQGVMAAVGHGIGVGVYALAAVTGLVFLLKAEPALINIINWAGAGFLAWVGFQLTGIIPQKCKVKDKNRETQNSRGFIEGFTVAFLNPKIAAFFVAVFSQFVHPDLIWFDRAIMVLTAATIDGAWYVIVALAVTVSGLVDWLRRKEVFANRIIGSLLLIASIGLILRAIHAAN